MHRLRRVLPDRLMISGIVEGKAQTQHARSSGGAGGGVGAADGGREAYAASGPSPVLHRAVGRGAAAAAEISTVRHAGLDPRSVNRAARCDPRRLLNCTTSSSATATCRAVLRDPGRLGGQNTLRRPPTVHMFGFRLSSTIPPRATWQARWVEVKRGLALRVHHRAAGRR